MFHFALRNVRGEREINLSCEAGCGVTVLCSDYGRIGPVLSVMFYYNVLYVTRINYESSFAWQVQYLVVLDVIFCAD